MTAILDRLRAPLAERYSLERELGQGGMATVFLAHDLKHDRDVAIKVLHPDLGAALGADRFLSEIRTTARLQHPHILPLLDSGSAAGLLFYVMPYVAGETLRARLDRERQLPVEDALRIAREVADALGEAHAHGVVHRDIKPENILLQGGHALVADFGISLAVQSAGGSRMTQTGLSLGTPQYMSPEQAMGERTIDARSDIYALAAVTYEMLAGEPPFTGPTVQAILARVMAEEPRPLGKQRKAIPPHVESALFTALEKLPADRFATAAEFLAALGGAKSTRTTSRVQRSAAQPAGPWRSVSIALGVVAVVAIGLGAWPRGHDAGVTMPLTYDAALPDSAPMFFSGQTPATPYGTAMQNLAISEDGTFAVYLARQGESTLLWRRSLRDASAHPIDGTEGGIMPRISPDGSRLAFLAGTAILTVPIAGGQARRVVDITGQVTMLEWTSASRLLTTDIEGYRVRWLDAETGEVSSRPIPRCLHGRWVPDDELLLCSMGGTGRVVDPRTGDFTVIRTRTQEGGAPVALPGTAFRIVRGGFLVYTAAEGDVRAARYDRRTHEAGRSVSLIAGVRREAIGSAQLDVNAAGTLIYAPGGNGEVGQLVELDADGTLSPLPVAPGPYQRWDLSRDRRWLALVGQAPGQQELRIHDLRDRQSFVWLRGEGLGQPLWSPDGTWLLVSVDDARGTTLLRGSPFTATPPDTVFGPAPGDQVPYPLDLHGPNVALGRVGSAGSSAIVRFDPLLRAGRYDTLAIDRVFAMLSPDGRHLAFTVSAGSRIVVTSSPPAGSERQVAASSVEPLWLSNTELLVRSGVTWNLARLNAATGEPTSQLTAWGHDARFSDTFGWSNRPNWRGGITYLQGPPETTTAYLRVIPNWVAQVKQAVEQAER